ncbi:hypothetical protein G7Y89_g9624 [Cudoniella acicularis]|uniref:Uncharacterized protein n=1 Tax=Cudoniella acicularis TaxID=354080 RepID=A0A8H4REB3_9HELO|nr:hypothetical protein G7Y89_g9624 [Cudoniella acicularis]
MDIFCLLATTPEVMGQTRALDISNFVGRQARWCDYGCMYNVRGVDKLVELVRKNIDEAKADKNEVGIKWVEEEIEDREEGVKELEMNSGIEKMKEEAEMMENDIKEAKEESEKVKMDAKIDMIEEQLKIMLDDIEGLKMN